MKQDKTNKDCMRTEGTGELRDVNEDISPQAKLQTSTAFTNSQKTMLLTINHADSAFRCLGKRSVPINM